MPQNLQGNKDRLISELRDSLAWMDLVLSNVKEGVLVVEEDMEALFVNDALADMVDKPRIKLLGTPVWEILKLTDDGEPLRENDFQSALKQSDLESLAGRYEFHGKENLKVEITISGIPSLEHIIFIIHDVTRQVQREKEIIEERLAHSREKFEKQKIKENERLLQSIINCTSEIIYLKDLEGRYIMVNQQFEEVFGLKEKEIKGKKDSDIFPAKLANIFRKNDSEVLQIGETIRWEETISPKEGKENTYLHLKYPLIDSNGNIHSLCGVLTDITERKELDRRKNDFIKMASHELQTPLTSVKMFLTFTRQHIEKGEVEQSLHYLSKFSSRLDELTDLISELLNVSQIETGKLELKKKQFNLIALVEEEIETVQTTTDKHQIDLREKPEKISVVADRQRIGQVILNLLTNAVKYSPDGGDILVCIMADEDQVTVSVQDFGIGISQKDQENIFGRFYKASNEGMDFPGLGIGLYIASDIIGRHGGKMNVESEKGNGSIFSFQLPVAEKSLIKE